MHNITGNCVRFNDSINMLLHCSTVVQVHVLHPARECDLFNYVKARNQKQLTISQASERCDVRSEFH